ncbi:PfkB family carbohydrate kinase [soil metagenome]
MSLLVIGTLALDTIETPFGIVENTFGGSAAFISVAASYFTNDIRLVGIVGNDFPDNELEFLKSKNIDTSGVEVSKSEKTFHWHGKYHFDMNERDTLVTDLNALAIFDPKISEKYQDSEYICLGNMDPVIQIKIIKQLKKPKLVMVDTMNYWIESNLEGLKNTLKSVDLIVINDSEARQLTNEYNLISASKKIRDMGPKYIIIKKGEHGAYLFTKDSMFAAPAFPLEQVFDPTGAGDTFAGGLMGWLSKTNDFSDDNMKLAVIYGSAMASLCVEEFALEGIRNLSNERIMQRFKDFKSLTNFNEIHLD